MKTPLWRRKCWSVKECEGGFFFPISLRKFPRFLLSFFFSLTSFTLHHTWGFLHHIFAVLRDFSFTSPSHCHFYRFDLCFVLWQLLLDWCFISKLKDSKNQRFKEICEHGSNRLIWFGREIIINSNFSWSHSSAHKSSNEQGRLARRVYQRNRNEWMSERARELSLPPVAEVRENGIATQRESGERGFHVNTGSTTTREWA